MAISAICSVFDCFIYFVPLLLELLLAIFLAMTLFGNQKRFDQLLPSPVQGLNRIPYGL